MAATEPRRRPRRGSLERPLSTRIYRAAWAVAVLPLLVAAFTVGEPEPLPEPTVPPSFDQTTAAQLAAELVRRFPDRSPGSPGARRAAAWVVERLREYALVVDRQPFSADIPGRGRSALVNLVAVVPGRSQQAIVVMAHRDNLGRSPGANDNASGTAALIELARNVGAAQLAHTLVFLSSDGGAFGGEGAARFVERSGYGRRTVAVVNLDAIAGPGPPRLALAGDAARSPDPAFVASAAEAMLEETGSPPRRPGAVAQLLDLAFPFSLYEQAPFVAHGIPAVTLTTGGDRPLPPEGDTATALDAEKLGNLGRAAQGLVAAVDQAPEVARETNSYLYLGSRSLRGWALQLVLLAALLPFLAVTVDFFARCRRRRIALAPALRSYASRLGVWLWAGGVFAFLGLVGALPNGDARPLSPDTPAAQRWAVAALAALATVTGLGWLVARPRLAPTRPVARADELGGQLAAMLVLAVVALVVAASNPYALLFVLPSLHAWLWLPHAAETGLRAKLGLYALGFLGPAVLVGSFSVRYDLGLDSLWYLLALAAVGFVPVPLLLAFLAWGAAAQQVGALVAGRYAPYPDPHERPARGPIRETIRTAVLLSRRLRRARERQAATEDGARALEEQ